MQSEKLLNSSEIELIKESAPGWSVKEKKIYRDFEFTNFIEAFGFITQIALLAESTNHHPEWSNVYSKVKIQLTTHDLKGISTIDLKFANEINKIFEQFKLI